MSYFPIPPQDPRAVPNMRADTNNQNNAAEEEPIQNRSAIFNTLFENQYQLVKEPRSFKIAIAVMGLIFLVLSIVTLILALDVKNIDIGYAQVRKCAQTGRADQKCSVKFHVDQDIRGPVYLLYYVKNLYINHRRFLSSYSVDQKSGKVISPDIAEKQCGNFVFNSQISQKVSWTGQRLNPNDIASMCGAKPQGYFNDTFALYRNGQPISIDDSNIYNGKAVNSYRTPNSEATQWADPQNQHFKLYMLDGSLMTKKRLWGVLSNGLPSGDYNLVVNNNYQMADMRIIKGVLFTTANIMGGKQFFYPVVFFAFFLFCLGLFIFLKVKLANYKHLKEHDVKFRS